MGSFKKAQRTMALVAFKFFTEIIYTNGGAVGQNQHYFTRDF